MKTIDELFSALVKDLKITDPADMMLIRVYLDMASDIGGLKAIEKLEKS